MNEILVFHFPSKFSPFSSFPNLFLVYLQRFFKRVWVSSYDTTCCLRHHRAFIQLKWMNSPQLACARTRIFQVIVRMLVRDTKTENFLTESERSYILLRPGQVVLSESVCEKSGDQKYIKWWSITVQNGNHFKKKYEKTFRENVIKFC